MLRCSQRASVSSGELYRNWWPDDTLVSDIGGPSGGGKHTHAHAYMTADNRNVIYNAPTLCGATQVCAARVPDGFLESLA